MCSQVILQITTLREGLRILPLLIHTVFVKQVHNTNIGMMLGYEIYMVSIGQINTPTLFIKYASYIQIIH